MKTRQGAPMAPTRDTGAVEGIEALASMAPQRIYHAAKGARLSDADAAIIGPALEQLAAARGLDAPEGLTPAEIVTAALPNTSPLHRFFEWDDSDAARQYRLWQARHLANSWRVEIAYVDDTRSPASYSVPGLVSVVTQPQAPGEDLRRAYIPITDALAQPGYRAQIVTDARRRLDYWRQRFALYQHLPEFAPLAGVFTAIADALAGESEAEGEREAEADPTLPSA